MKVTKRQLKRIIREELNRMIKESHVAPYQQILDLASRPQGVDLDEINDLFGESGFSIIDEMEEEQLVWLDDQEGVVYSMRSPGLKPAVDQYTRR